MEGIRFITYADALKMQTTCELEDIELLAIRIQDLGDSHEASLQSGQSME
jgi:hypothetical protein